MVLETACIDPLNFLLPYSHSSYMAILALSQIQDQKYSLITGDGMPKNEPQGNSFSGAVYEEVQHIEGPGLEGG